MRNQWVFKNKWIQADILAAQALTMYIDFHLINPMALKPIIFKWSTPLGVVRINVDGEVFLDYHKIGVGCVL